MNGRAFLAALCVCLTIATHALAARRVVSLNLCTDQWLVLLAPEKVAALSPLARDPALSHVAAQAAGLPVTRASAEAVLSFHPDLVLGTRFGATATLAMLERQGIPVARLAIPTDFPGIRAVMRQMAALLDVPDRFDIALPPPGPPAEALVWEPRGWTAGPGGMMDAVLRAAGLTNAGSGARVGLEALLRHPPAVLILDANTAGESLATAMIHHPALRGIPVRTLPVPLTICPGPFTTEAVARLVR